MPPCLTLSIIRYVSRVMQWSNAGKGVPLFPTSWCSSHWKESLRVALDYSHLLSFPKKGDLGIAKNYRGIALTSITAKIYNALLRNRIEPKIEKILRKNQNGFRRNWTTTLQILTIRRILERVREKKTWGNTIIRRFLQSIWLHTQREDGANTTRLWPLQRNRRSHDDAI